MITSAKPHAHSRTGSVSSTLGSDTTHSGWWNAPTAFFAAGRSIPVLPPTAASTIPTSEVGTAIQGTPRW